MKINEVVFDALSDVKKINIIDIGCARGGLISEVVLPNRNLESVYSVGIDPLNHGVKSLYNHFVQVGIDDIFPSKFKLKRFYVNSDDQASSLLKMNYENITENLSDVSRIYVPWASKLRVRVVIPIIVVNLESIIRKYFSLAPIHFIKIDAEGNDLNVIKSQSFRNRPLFISAETSNHKDSRIRIFKGGSQREELVAYMNSKNYSIYHEVNYAEIKNHGTQMSDIVFKDTLNVS
jgi:hypothetical protein